ncbi:MAG: hypothetical protein FWE80_04275, partial [Oscillospiraceae bacterium]|nr:hypothetical protein [Oscillospiraceae bacterium]
MNRIVIALIIFTLLLPLAACKDPAPDSSMPVFVIRTTTTTEPTAETTWPADPWPVDPWPTDPPKPVRPDSTPFPLPESIGDSRPAPLPDFNPACNVLPLLSQPSVYGMHVMGQLNFIDRQYNLIPVPEQAEMYYTPYEFNGEDYLPQAYCLYDNDQKMAVMDLSGNLLTGFEYDYYSTYEGPDLGNFKGYLIVCKKQNPGTDNEQPFFGVLDLKTGKEVLPPVYNYLYLMDGYIYTEKDGEMNIFDYAGKRLVGPEKAAPDFLAPKPESPHFNSAEAPYRMSYSSFRDTMYYGELGQYMLVWGTGKPNEMPKVSVYDRSKTHLLTIDFKDFY